jgi:hypothetical protein
MSLGRARAACPDRCKPRARWPGWPASGSRGPIRGVGVRQLRVDAALDPVLSTLWTRRRGTVVSDGGLLLPPSTGDPVGSPHRRGEVETMTRSGDRGCLMGCVRPASRVRRASRRRPTLAADGRELVGQDELGDDASSVRRVAVPAWESGPRWLSSASRRQERGWPTGRGAGSGAAPRRGRGPGRPARPSTPPTWRT